MDEYNENAKKIAHDLDVVEISKTFKLSIDASEKLVTLIDNMGLTLDDVKTMSLEEIQIRHGAYMLEKSNVERQVEEIRETVPESKPDWRRLSEDLEIFKAKAEREKKQEEMAAVREQYPENYANRAERRRILKANKKGNK